MNKILLLICLVAIFSPVILWAAESSPPAEGQTSPIFQKAIEDYQNQITILDQWLAAGNSVATLVYQGRSCLIGCMDLGRPELAQWLIDKGLNKENLSPADQSFVMEHWVSRLQDQELWLKLFLAAGFTPDSHLPGGKSWLALAAEFWSPQPALLLLEAGAGLATDNGVDKALLEKLVVKAGRNPDDQKRLLQLLKAKVPSADWQWVQEKNAQILAKAAVEDKKTRDEKTTKAVVEGLWNSTLSLAVLGLAVYTRENLFKAHPLDNPFLIAESNIFLCGSCGMVGLGAGILLGYGLSELIGGNPNTKFLPVLLMAVLGATAGGCLGIYWANQPLVKKWINDYPVAYYAWPCLITVGNIGLTFQVGFTTGKSG